MYLGNFLYLDTLYTRIFVPIFCTNQSSMQNCIFENIGFEQKYLLHSWSGGKISICFQNSKGLFNNLNILLKPSYAFYFFFKEICLPCHTTIKKKVKVNVHKMLNVIVYILYKCLLVLSKGVQNTVEKFHVN